VNNRRDGTRYGAAGRRQPHLIDNRVLSSNALEAGTLLNDEHVSIDIGGETIQVAACSGRVPRHRRPETRAPQPHQGGDGAPIQPFTLALTHPARFDALAASASTSRSRPYARRPAMLTPPGAAHPIGAGNLLFATSGPVPARDSSSTSRGIATVPCQVNAPPKSCNPPRIDRGRRIQSSPPDRTADCPHPAARP